MSCSDKDSFFQRSFIESSASSLRHAYLRKTDLLDTLDSNNSRLRDTDAWSVAATIDDQESVISAHGGPPSIISSSRMTIDRETDDDRSTLDGESSIRDRLQDIHLSSSPLQIHISNSNSNNNNNNNSNNTISSNNTNNSRLDAMLHDLVNPHNIGINNHHHHHHHLLRGSHHSIIADDEEDKRSRSNAAEFGDDGTRSAAADFDHSVASDDDSSHHNVVDDQIMAPPQPQPSFASVTKSYAELMEENEILQTQLRAAQLAQKHQEQMIQHLRHLTGCDDELYGKAVHLSQRGGEEMDGHKENSGHDSSNTSDRGDSNLIKEKEMFFDSPSLEHIQVPPIVNARTLTQKLARLAETLIRFVKSIVSEENEWQQLNFEQSLFFHITQLYLEALPFGTENQHLLNTAYQDQIHRFHNTLGANFAKWYRRQTVQSLSLNPATKEYLQNMRNVLTEEMLRQLHTQNCHDEPDMNLWEDILELCAALSLEIHGGDADVTAQTIAVGSKYDEEIMAAALVGNEVHNNSNSNNSSSNNSSNNNSGSSNSSSSNNATKDKVVKMMISPLFIDEEEVVLLPARVIIE
ncbi:uncharacterized protein BX663DRAFT_554341 [Cokeromyces recurvatus]|uniref:uncharacterized protein n=1 Tax=Cokeromyces recurvatus TaxID=90255 RepID=UPI002220D7A1|nr:uncharacterized protein BX663DRAFT_564166 [Cokeromyces recurvatus]XP_051380152.1 uncharacterized protein BX663DRAFT_554341 [Cokeromyces recurvatus]KAI7899117.1 hypothetical protein BX663DRAFT_564166 [Cokeromyces recurvatus]KAI7900167.1 hypothetical protein BX663DRAFT_554341 [Cokeromyces recurvatus]